MAGRVAVHLRDRGQTARTVTTKLRYPDFSIRTRSTSLPAGTDDGDRIGAARVRAPRPRAARPARPTEARRRRRLWACRACAARVERRLVQRSEWSGIAHTGMEIMNPLPAEKLDAAIDALGYVGGALAIDLGCGKGDLLGRLADRHAGGVGVDLSRDFLDHARVRAPDFEFVEADVTTYETSRTFDIAASVGSPATLSQLAALVGPGGRVLYGNGYWRQKPTQAYLEALGATEDELTDYAETVLAGETLGLTLLHATTASVDDFDRYEERWARNGERLRRREPERARRRRVPRLDPRRAPPLPRSRRPRDARLRAFRLRGLESHAWNHSNLPRKSACGSPRPTRRASPTTRTTSSGSRWPESSSSSSTPAGTKGCATRESNRWCSSPTHDSSSRLSSTTGCSCARAVTPSAAHASGSTTPWSATARRSRKAGRRTQPWTPRPFVPRGFPRGSIDAIATGYASPSETPPRLS